MPTESNQDLPSETIPQSACGSPKLAISTDHDGTRSNAANIFKPAIKKIYAPAGRKLTDIDPSLSGSRDLGGDSKPQIAHHRVSDLTELEDIYDIGKKLGQ